MHVCVCIRGCVFVCLCIWACVCYLFLLIRIFCLYCFFICNSSRPFQNGPSIICSKNGDYYYHHHVCAFFFFFFFFFFFIFFYFLFCPPFLSVFVFQHFSPREDCLDSRLIRFLASHIWMTQRNEAYDTVPWNLFLTSVVVQWLCLLIGAAVVAGMGSNLTQPFLKYLHQLWSWTGIL